MFQVIIIGVILVSITLMFYVQFDVSRSRFKYPPMQMIWFLLVLFIPLFGALIYFTLRKELIRGPRHFNPDFQRIK